MYTGRRGRPKKLRPGEADPHADERKRIQENILKEIFTQLNKTIFNQYRKKKYDVQNLCVIVQSISSVLEVV